VARDVTADLEAEQLKADFVATVSHELRTPLTPLKGFLTSLIKGTVEDSPEARAEYYRIMANQVDRLERLINDLLEASRIESGKSLVESRSLDLAAVLGAQVAEFASAHPDRSIILSPTLPVMVSADPLRLEQVASNLIANACKYSPAGSTVTVSISRTPSHAIVNVRDEGEGIPLSEQDKVFERFHRVENGLTRRTGGAGLGLYIAKRLVEAMSGRVWVVSRPGVGSTFSFSLPLEEAEDHAASGPTPASLATV
jgi:two-component system phosphate regulon sensor histidine kinase PhoR